MYISLNPDKAFRFTTKGISLTPRNPIAFVPPDLDKDCMDVIRKALNDGILFKVEDGGSKIALKNVGLIELHEDEGDFFNWKSIDISEHQAVSDIHEIKIED